MVIILIITIITITILAQKCDIYFIHNSLPTFTLFRECRAGKLLNILLYVSSILNSSWWGLDLGWGGRGRIAPVCTTNLPVGVAGLDCGLLWALGLTLCFIETPDTHSAVCTAAWLHGILNSADIKRSAKRLDLVTNAKTERCLSP